VKTLDLNFEVGTIAHNLIPNHYENLEFIKSNYLLDLNFIYFELGLDLLFGVPKYVLKHSTIK